MIQEIADSLGIDPVLIYGGLGILLIVLVYDFSPKAGWLLAILAILGITAKQMK